MCSFHFSTIKPVQIDGDDGINFYLKKRGPDATNIVYNKNHTFIHNLLSLTGAFTVQPLIEDDIYVLFNGELYNYLDFGKFDNDTKCIIAAYNKWGIEFPRYLDGEFAITLVDYKKQIILVTSDVFACKPIWISIENKEFGASSYKSSLLRTGFSNNKIEKLPANTTRIYSLDNKELLFENTIYDFNLDQYKNTFDDWILAFEQSVAKRCLNVREGMFIGLSSGYDSGSILCALLNLNIKFDSYTLSGTENEKVLQQRYEKILNNSVGNSYICKNKSAEFNIKASKWMNENVEEFLYQTWTLRSDYNERSLRLHEDNGSLGLTTICDWANLNNKKIHISGMGADEHISDYGFNGQSKYFHSNFGGLYPKDLKTIFPWPSFYGSSMISYLGKEEYIGGGHGIENRYPFLDPKVVQEFLNLSVDLKNSKYKSVLHEYLTRNNFPFDPGQKIGF